MRKMWKTLRSGLKCRNVFYLSAAVLCAVLAWQSWRLPGLVGIAVAARVDPALVEIGKRLDARDKQFDQLLQKTDKTLDNVAKFTEDTYYDNYANVQTSTVILRDLAEIVHDVRVKLLPEIQATVKTANSLLHSVQTDFHNLTEETRTALRPVASLLLTTEGLIQTLDRQVQVGSVEALQTAEKIGQNLDALHKLLSDPNIGQTLANVQESTKTVDEVLRPLRTKVGLVKAIVGRVIAMLKFDVTKLWE